ncbi:SLC13 family permease [Lederbergia wuyishanensis]|uniref:Di/tricarboxylate transporter n=1 Tax=Lederbergia wuyishanensis TaxID=1347903 RepID=A0ABU0D0A6_9BACI|nr:SLC13 family permease [Lederbergia wuyishanensis]MCJ8006458.1 SLC13 family permease [Lederbergia wuyishanensis]MDQ0341834.1 di/tricarboxylate transporter [Lederbergia wuyishanensis]
MTSEIGFVLLILILMLLGLVFEITRPDIILFFTLSLLLLSGIITTEEALKGFSNEGMLTIALLFIVAASIQKSGIADRVIRKLLGSSNSIRWTLFKILTPVTAFSSVLNNTPIVVTLTPILRKWCADHQLSPSKFLIPLSYATILGGTLTLIGTSTNLVVHGMLLDAGKKGFSFFQIGFVAFPAVFFGLLYIILFGYKLLPDHKDLLDKVNEHSKEYISQMEVDADFPFLNASVETAGLRRLKGLFLIEIIRKDEKVSPVKSTTIIREGDKLIFTGLISTIAELQKIKGLQLRTDSDFSLDMLKNGNTQLIEAVVSHHSSLLYKKIQDSNFRSKFDAGVIAVHRHRERIKSKIGDITLKPGDTLLLLCGPDFDKKISQSNDFYVTTPLKTPSLLEDQRKGLLSLFLLLTMIMLVTLNILSMLKAMILLVILLLLLKVITPEEAIKSLHIPVLLLIACAFGIGTALLESGTASFLAGGMVHLAKPYGILAVIGVLYLVTNLLTEIITNSAAAVIMFPISLEMAQQIGIDPIPLVLAITIAASASFSTPIGYQTNLIVYGPGGYKFIDYVRIGFPLNIIVMLSTILMIYTFWI